MASVLRVDADVPDNPCMNHMLKTADAAPDNLERRVLAMLADAPLDEAALAVALGVSEAALTKVIAELGAAGIAIDKVPGQGYRLLSPPDLLEAADIRAALAPMVVGQLAALEVCWRIDSTNSALLASECPVQGCRVLLAEQQQAGRGRRGRHWVSPLAANLYLSLARGFEGGLARLSGLSVVAGIAVAEALRAHVGLDVRLKWPNDLWLGDCKLGGLLVETDGRVAGRVQAVIGIGLNIRMPKEAASAITQEWTDLASHLVAPPVRNAVVAAILNQLIPALVLFEADGLAAFETRFAALDALHGRAITVHLGDETYPAQSLGLAASGGLRVWSARGEECLHAGEVSIRVPT